MPVNACCCGGTQYRQARWCSDTTLGPVSMTTTDAATLTTPFYISGVGCFYFDFGDSPTSSPATEVYTAAAAIAYADCTTCAAACGPSTVPQYLYMHIDKGGATSWGPCSTQAGAGDACSPDTLVITLDNGGFGFVWTGYGCMFGTQIFVSLSWYTNGMGQIIYNYFWNPVIGGIISPGQANTADKDYPSATTCEATGPYNSNIDCRPTGVTVEVKDTP